MVTAIWTVITFCLLIFIHELGHFLMAKKVGVTVHEFAIGMGPKIFQKQGKETLYSVRLLPIGGYVKLEGEDEESSSDGALCNKTPLQKFLVVVAGAVMNLILGFIIFVIIVSFKGAGTNVISEVIKDSPMEKAGFVQGDRIVKMEGEKKSSKISYYNDIVLFNMENNYGDAYITVKRADKEITKLVSPDEAQKTFGFKVSNLDKNPVSVVGAAFNEAVFMCRLVFLSFMWLFTGKVPVSSLSGPVGIVSTIGEASKTGVINVLYIMALISINLGIVNLFPLPALDGGRLVFIIIEMIRRKPVDSELEGKIHFIGFALLLAFMLFVTYFDMQRIFG